MPLVWPALGLALGLFGGVAWDMSSTAVVLLLVVVAGAWLLARSTGLRLGFAALFAAAFLLGILRAGPGLLEESRSLVSFHGQPVELTGIVQGLPETVGTRVRFDLRLTSISAISALGEPPIVPAEAGTLGAALGDTVLVWLHALRSVEHGTLRHGNTVTITGRLDAPQRFGGFDYPEHLAARGVGSVLSGGELVHILPSEAAGIGGALHDLRRSLASSIAAHLPEPQAALTQALLLGLRGGMPVDISDDFRRAGVAHLLAVSGMHVGLVLGLSLFASAALIGRHRPWYVVPPFLLLWTYVLLSGAPPSAIRAAAMGSVLLLALATGRASVSLNALGMAALVLLALEPRMLWDRSFQLSFAAMAGVLAIGLPLWLRVEPALRTWPTLSILPWWEKVRMRGKRSPSSAVHQSPSAMAGSFHPHLALTRWVVAGFLVSLGATLGSLPLVAFNFQQVPLLGIPATLIAVPFLPPLLVTGALAAVAGLLLPPLGAALAWLPAFFGWLIVSAAAIFAAASWSVIETETVAAREVWLSYSAAFALFAVLYRRHWLPALMSLAAALWRGPAQPAHAALLVAAFTLLAAAPWAAAVARPDGHLHVHFLDVGQGDATLVLTPAGASLLIDGGPDPRVTLRQLDAVLPATRPVIDLAVLTHPHADHMNGLLELARRGRIEQVLVPPLLPGDDGRWLAELEANVHGVHVVTAGALVELDDDVRLEVPHPPLPLMSGTRSDIDNNSLVVRLVYGESAVLITGDLFAEGEHVLIESGADLTAQVLKLGHHGSSTSTSPELLAAVRPAIAVVSAGEFDHRGHPGPDVVARTLEHVPEDLLFQTAFHGAISLATDGERWWAATER